MLGSIGKGNCCFVVVFNFYGQNKQPTNAYKATKRLQHKNRTKYQTIVEEIRLQLTQVLYLLLFKLASCIPSPSL